MNILGISAYYHDSAACLIQNGEIVAAAQEERFTRKKQDPGFPLHAVRYCLAEGKVEPGKLDAICFYDKPITKFMRIMRTYTSIAPLGLRAFKAAIPVSIKEKIWIPLKIEQAMQSLGYPMPEKMYYTEHHQSHIASAFYPSPFESAAVLTVDGVGEWASTTLAHGRGSKLDILEEIHFPHSLGLLYSAFTYFTGFRVNSGEYKLMGLAPYGEPKYVNLIKDKLIDLKPDGSFALNMKYFGYLDDLKMTNKRFAELFGGPERQPESQITPREMDIARSIQDVTEEAMFNLARRAQRMTGEKNLCLAGGVALNCVANGKLLKESQFENIWIQPASGDAGGALGAALFTWHTIEGKDRTADGKQDKMKGSYLGPLFPDEQIKKYLDANGYAYRKLDKNERAETIAELIDKQNVIGLHQGRMEFGPRALGARSIIGDARSQKMQSIMNLKIKYRESFRPFAPSCLVEDVGELFELKTESPYMLLVADVKKERCTDKEGDERSIDLIEWVNRARSDIPAITHVDYSARVQTVDKQTNPEYHDIISAFKKKTGYGVIINTSFNVRGEPIVCTPEDAYRCFMRTEMDYLVLGSFLLDKKEQPDWQEKNDWRDEFQLD